MKRIKPAIPIARILLSRRLAAFVAAWVGLSLSAPLVAATPPSVQASGELASESLGSRTAIAPVSSPSAAPASAPPSVPAPEPSSTAATPASAPASSSAIRGNVVSVTKVVGEVGGRFITSREVRMNDAVEQAVSGKPSDPALGFRILTGQEKTFSRSVGLVLDEWVVFLEAKSLSAQVSSRNDVSRHVKAVQERWAKDPAWRQLEVSAEELREVVERKLVVQDFVRLKADPQTLPVSDEDAHAYYKQNRLRFGSLPFASFKDSIKAFLVKQQTERRLADWHEVLRRRYKVRNFISG